MRIRACLEVAKGDSDAFARIVHIVLKLGAVAPTATREFNLIVALLPHTLVHRRPSPPSR